MASMPHLKVADLPSTSSEDAAATSSPARGREMRKDLLQKLRPPPLVHSWDFWHDRQSRSKLPDSAHPTDFGNSSATSAVPGKYEDRLVHMTSIKDVKAFWSMFNNFDITTLQLRDSIHLFHQGIKPVWEDPRNVRGGSWTFRVPKEKAVEFWKEICMMAIGEQLQAAVSSQRLRFIDDICGISLSVRFTSILIQVWNRDGEHKDGIDKILSTVMENLPLELRPNSSTHTYYKKHSDHAGFNVGSTSVPSGEANSATGPSLTGANDLNHGPTMPPRTDGPHTHLDNATEERHEQAAVSDITSPPGITPTVRSNVVALTDGEALQDVEETLGAMKAAMDRVEK